MRLRRFLQALLLLAVVYVALKPVLVAAQVVPSGQTFRCTPVAVWDGDGPVWCAEGSKVRVAGVAAREIDGTCKSSQPCPGVGAIDAVYTTGDSTMDWPVKGVPNSGVVQKPYAGAQLLTAISTLMTTVDTNRTT